MGTNDAKVGGFRILGFQWTEAKSKALCIQPAYRKNVRLETSILGCMMSQDDQGAVPEQTHLPFPLVLLLLVQWRDINGFRRGPLDIPSVPLVLHRFMILGFYISTSRNTAIRSSHAWKAPAQPSQLESESRTDFLQLG